MPNGDSTFISLLIIASLSILIPFAVKKFNRISIPISVGEIIAGIIIGKSGFNIIQMNAVLEILFEIGLTFLVFLIGRGIDLNFIKNSYQADSCRVKNPLIIAFVSFALCLSTAFIFAAVLKYFEFISNMTIFALLFCNTAVEIVKTTLKEKKLLETNYGHTMLISAVISNFASMIILSVYISIVNKYSPKDLLPIILFIPVFVLCKYLARKLLRFFSGLSGSVYQLSIRLSNAVLLLYITASFLLKTHMIIGTFFAGLLFSVVHRREMFFEKFDVIRYNIFISIFFITVGIKFDLKAIVAHQSALILLPIIVIIIYTINVLSGLLYRTNYNDRFSLAASVLLSTRLSLMGAVAYKMHLIDNIMNSVIVMSAIITCLISPVMFNKLYDSGLDLSSVNDNFIHRDIAQRCNKQNT